MQPPTGRNRPAMSPTKGNSMTTFDQGPFIAAALLCETVLTEASSVISAIRIVDRINRAAIGSEPPSGMEPFTYKLTLLLVFKAGSARGPMQLEIRLQKPSGESQAPVNQTLNFEGDDERGVNVIAEMNLRIDMPGLHWFDIYLEQQRMTRIPLRVVYQITQTHTTTGPAPSE